VTFSAGIACYPDDRTTPEDLLQVADEALYEAKHRGRNQIRHAGHRHTQGPPDLPWDRSTRD
jgi:diguanylate cyclase (GGDEF)-like protein